MDDDNPTEVTAGAIVTVTVTLVRKDMSTLFGDDTVKEVTSIAENGTEEVKEGAGEPENEAVIKRPAWLKQKRGEENADIRDKTTIFFFFKVVVRKLRSLANKPINRLACPSRRLRSLQNHLRRRKKNTK